MKIINDKAKFNYELLERYEAGIVLTGPEVKSAKMGQADMGNSFVKIQNSKFRGQRELWVFNLHIYPYKYADNTNYLPDKPRKLLVHQRELVALQSKMKQARLLLVPTAMYTRSDRIKLEIALARGKKIYEKREAIGKRDAQRDIERGIRGKD
jgi:SsrA-binding protein